MHNVTKGKEIVVTLTNRVGAGAFFFKLFQTGGVNVVASSCFQNGPDVHFSLVPDDLDRALEVLRQKDLTPELQDVLLVEMPNEPGAFAQLLQEIADLGVGIRSAYATTSVRERALAVLMTDDDQKVLDQLR